MKETAISVTEAARNFAECLNRAHYQNVTFVLLKSGKPVARLIPDREKVCTGADLAKALENAELPADEAKAWYRDLRAGRRRLKAPVDRWR
jgi:antitoxin (DNA-binding transcriptional repressor) of toxin-antitoxin stability system